jgi:hypothetical protein
MRHLPCYFSLLLLTGCVSYIQAPGAIGRVIDAETGRPIRGAKITRPAAKRSWNTPQGLPQTTVTTGRFGRFRVPVERESQFFLSLHTTPEIFTPTFSVVADGYVSTNITSIASSNSHWNVDLGQVRLTRR